MHLMLLQLLAGREVDGDRARLGVGAQDLGMVGFDQTSSSYGEYITRTGGIFSPQIPNVEPLRVECEHFVRCLRTGERPRSDGETGLRVVRVLEELQNSLDGSLRVR